MGKSRDRKKEYKIMCKGKKKQVERWEKEVEGFRTEVTMRVLVQVL